MANPTIVYFGQHPTSIMLKSTNGFNGTAHTGTPALSPGLYSFEPQAGGGLYAFHTEPVDIKNIAFKGTGTLSIKKVFGGQEAEIAKIENGQGEFFENFTLTPNEQLKFQCSGAATVVVTAALTNCFWGT